MATDLQQLLRTMVGGSTIMLLLNQRVRPDTDLPELLRPLEEALFCSGRENEDVFPALALLPTAEYGQRLDTLLQKRGKLWTIASNNAQESKRFYAYMRGTRSSDMPYRRGKVQTVLCVVDVLDDRILLEALLSWRATPERRVVIVGIIYEDEDPPFIFEESRPVASTAQPYCYAFVWPGAVVEGLRIGSVTLGKNVHLTDRWVISDPSETDMDVLRRFVQNVKKVETVVY